MGNKAQTATQFTAERFIKSISSDDAENFRRQISMKPGKFPDLSPCDAPGGARTIDCSTRPNNVLRSPDFRTPPPHFTLPRTL